MSVFLDVARLDLHKQLCEVQFRGRSEVKPPDFYYNWFTAFFTNVSDSRTSNKFTCIEGQDDRLQFDLAYGTKPTANPLEISIILPVKIDQNKFTPAMVLRHTNPHTITCIYECGKYQVLSRSGFDEVAHLVPEAVQYLLNHSYR